MAQKPNLKIETEIKSSQSTATQTDTKDEHAYGVPDSNEVEDPLTTVGRSLVAVGRGGSMADAKSVLADLMAGLSSEERSTLLIALTRMASGASAAVTYAIEMHYALGV